MTVSYFRHFLKGFYEYDSFREKMTSILCYLIGVIVILRDFFRCGLCLLDMDGRSEDRIIPVRTLLCLYVRSFLGTLYPLRSYFYGRTSFFCPEGTLLHGSPSIVAWLQVDRVCGMADE